MPMRMSAEWLTKQGAVIFVEGFSPWRETPEGRTRDEGVEARAERGPSRA